MKRKFELDVQGHLQAPELKLKLTRELFGLIASEYDSITPALSLGRDQAWKRDLVASLPEIERPFCIDLACGTGDLTFLLAGRYPRGRILGLDLTAEMIERANARNKHPHVCFGCADMTKTGQPDGSADIVTGGYALRNASDLGTALDEIARVLKPGGIAAFLDFSKPRSRAGQVLTHALLKTWGSFWGLLKHGRPVIYGYIADSLRLHPDRPTLHQMFADRGMHVVASRLHYAGMLETLIVRKSERQSPCP